MRTRAGRPIRPRGVRPAPFRVALARPVVNVRVQAPVHERCRGALQAGSSGRARPGSSKRTGANSRSCQALHPVSNSAAGWVA